MQTMPISWSAYFYEYSLRKTEINSQNKIWAFFSTLWEILCSSSSNIYISFAMSGRQQLQKSSQIFPVYDVDFLVFLMTAFLKISLCFLVYKIPNRDFPWICCKVEKLENITLIFSSFGWGKNMWWIIITFMSITEGLPFNITLAKETNQLEEG